MRNKRLPSSKQWDKIINDAFKSDKHHDFSVSYELRKSEIQKGNTIKKETNHFHSRYMSMVAAAAAVIIAVPAIVFAYSNHSYETEPAFEIKPSEPIQTTTFVTEEVTTEPVTEETTYAVPVEDNTGIFQLAQNGKYQFILTYTPSYDELSNTQTYDFQYSWLPDGVAPIPDDPKKMCTTPTGGTLNMVCYRVKQGTSLEERISSIVNYEKLSDDEKTAYIFHSSSPFIDLQDQEKWSERDVWIKFNGTNIIAQLFATNDISSDDLKNIIRSVKLVPSDNELTEVWKNEYVTESKISEEEYRDEFLKTCKSINEIELTGIGKPIPHTVNNNSVEVTIDKAWIQDDFKDITTNTCCMPRDYSQFIDDDGKICKTYHWIKNGDGINTLDEIVETENVELKLIVLEMTYTNTSDHDIVESYDKGTTDFLIDPMNYLCVDGKLDPTDYMHREGLTVYSDQYIASDGGWVSFESDDHSSKNYINIPQGGQTHVKVSLLARADSLDDYYINIFGSYFDQNDPNNLYLAVKDIER